VSENVDGAKAPADDGRTRRLALDRAAHVFEHVHESHVALNARRPQSFHGDRAPGDRRQGEEVAGGRGIGLDGVIAATIARGPHVKPAELAVADRHAKRLHDSQSHRDVRLRHKNALDLDGRCLSPRGERQEERTQELAGDVASHEHIVAGQATGLDGDRRAARSQVRPGHGSEPVQSAQQVGNRPLAHAGAAVEMEGAGPRGRHRRQETQARPRIRQVKRGAPRRNGARATLNLDESGAHVMFDRDAEARQSGDHDLRVLAIECAAQQARPLGQRGDHEGAIGQALRAGNPHDAPRGRIGLGRDQ
jgi:hypothetical protein